MSIFQSGSIFLSHASADKNTVRQVYERLDAASTFYDIKTVEPGQPFVEAMKNGTQGRNIFVLFHSPNTKGTWVEYERKLAEVNLASRHGRVLVVPLGGETYRSLPEWMQAFMTCTEEFTVSDIVRQILFIQNELIDEASGNTKVVVGREDLLRRAHIKSMKSIHETGGPLQHVIVSGLPGMGRKTFAAQYVLKTLSSMRKGGPSFNLPDMAEAVDLYLAMKQDLTGIFSEGQLKEQIAAFREMTDSDQARMIFDIATHWADINQPIVLSTRLGLRDRYRNLKPWLKEFFVLSKRVPSLRVIYVSERQLPEETAIDIPNLMQIHVDELDTSDTLYILGELINPRYFDVAKGERLSNHIHGHPATAQYVAKFINSGKSIDTLNENPDPIYAFQDRILGGILTGDMISSDQKKILALLGTFPRLSFSILARVLELPRKKLSHDLWELQEASLISATSSEYYSCPSLISSKSRKELLDISEGLLDEVRKLIQDDLAAGRLDSQLIDALLIASVTPSGEVPRELNGLVTSSSLLTLVTDRFYRAREMQKDSRDVYLSAYNLSKLGLSMKASDDAVEQILFTGGDSAIRAGVYPKDIIEKMQNDALPSVYYLQGSYEFHVLRDDEAASKSLKLSLSMKHFKLRNVRLFARALIRSQDFHGALEVLNTLSDRQLERETGLLIQKIRAYRGIRNFKEADELERKLQGRDDENGEISIYSAGKYLQDQKFDDALDALDKAEKAPRVNRFSWQLLRCAVLVEKGDPSLLALVVELANSIGRAYDAHQLQARHAVVQGRWADAEKHLSAIEKKDYFDLQIAQRMLHLKMEDLQVKTDAAAMKKCREDLEELARLSVRAPAGFRSS